MTLKGFFKIDEEYKKSLQKYEFKDGIFAVVYYLLAMILYYAMGQIYAMKNLYLGYQVNFFLVLLCIAYVSIRKQGLKTIGFGKRNLKESLVLGLSVSAILVVITIVSGILAGRHFNAVPKLIIDFGYYLIVIALVEEIVFRGFIQTRIYGMIKNPILAIIVSALMFMIIHIPFQMGAAHLDFISYISRNFLTLLFTFVWHIVFNFMYSKYNSIAAPTVFHAIMDWCNVLFVR